jgi:uncharacterized metal-binding protein
MKHRFKKIILTNPNDPGFILKKEYYSFSLLNRLQRLQLFFKTQTGWRLQFLYESIFNKNSKKKFAYERLSIHEKPLLYSCSGCSSAAQMANYLALQLDRKAVAEMSCIAGVGGNVKKLVRTAMSGRQLIVIDGCPLACAKACLGKYNLQPDIHFELTSLGVAKKNHVDFNLQQANEILPLVESRIMKSIRANSVAC